MTTVNSPVDALSGTGLRLFGKRGIIEPETHAMSQLVKHTGLMVKRQRSLRRYRGEIAP